MSRRNLQTVRFFDLPGLPYVKAVHGVNVANEFRRHAHDRFCIGIVRKGKRVIYHGGVFTIIPENGMFVINPGMAHACKSGDEEHSYQVICVDAEKMHAIAADPAVNAKSLPYFKNILIESVALASSFRNIFSLVENDASLSETEPVMVSLLSTLILHYGDGQPDSSRLRGHDRMIRRVCEYIRMHYAEDLSLKILSRVACLSPFHFQRLFLENKGVSPHDYLVQYRIRKSLELLAAGHSIVRAALDTGFVDQSHFTRSFKQITGVTPGVWLSGSRKIR